MAPRTALCALLFAAAATLSGCFLGPASAITEENDAYPFERMALGSARHYPGGGILVRVDGGYRSVGLWFETALIHLRNLGDGVFLMRVSPYDVIPGTTLATYAVLHLDHATGYAQLFRFNRNNERDAAFGVVACPSELVPEVDPLAGYYEFACAPDETALIAAARAAVANRVPHDPQLYALAQHADAPDTEFPILAVDSIRVGIDLRLPPGAAIPDGFGTDLVRAIAAEIGLPVTIEDTMSVSVEFNRADIAVVRGDRPPRGTSIATFAVGPIYLATRENDPLTASVAKAVADLTADGTIAALIARWAPELPR